MTGCWKYFRGVAPLSFLTSLTAVWLASACMPPGTRYSPPLGSKPLYSLGSCELHGWPPGKPHRLIDPHFRLKMLGPLPTTDSFSLMIVRAKSYIQALVMWLMGLGSFLPLVVFNLTDRAQAQGRVCPRGALALACLLILSLNRV